LEKVPQRARALSSTSYTLFYQHMPNSFIYNHKPGYLEYAYSKKVPARVRALSLCFSVSLSQRERDKEREKEREKERKRQSEGERERELSLFHSLFLSLSLSFIHVTYCTPQPVSALAFSLEDLLCTCSHIHLVGYGVATVSRIKLLVSFAEYCLFYRALFQKRPMI